MSKIKLLALALCCLLMLVRAEFQSAPYAEWAHSHLVWLNAKDQTQ